MAAHRESPVGGEFYVDELGNSARSYWTAAAASTRCPSFAAVRIGRAEVRGGFPARRRGYGGGQRARIAAGVVLTANDDD